MTAQPSSKVKQTPPKVKTFATQTLYSQIICLSRFCWKLNCWKFLPQFIAYSFELIRETNFCKVNRLRSKAMVISHLIWWKSVNQKNTRANSRQQQWSRGVIHKCFMMMLKALCLGKIWNCYRHCCMNNQLDREKVFLRSNSMYSPGFKFMFWHEFSFFYCLPFSRMLFRVGLSLYIFMTRLWAPWLKGCHSETAKKSAFSIKVHNCKNYFRNDQMWKRLNANDAVQHYIWT